MNPRDVVRARIKELREAHGWTQAALARRLIQLGSKLDRIALVRVEQGRRGVQVDELYVLALALDVNVTALLTPANDEDEVQLTEGLISVSATSHELRRWSAGAAPFAPYQDVGFFKRHAGSKR